jgi:hypothetical protein
MPWSSTLAAAIDSSSTRIELTSAFFPQSRTNYVYIESECIRVMGGGGTVMFVDRGQLGTDAAAHSAGATVGRFTTSTVPGGGDHPDLAAHDALGLSTQVELDDHVAASDPHVAYALDADLANHEADTTSVHGIANTANLSLTSHIHDYAASSHSHVDGDLPAGLARDAEVAAAYSPLGHSHGGGSEAFPVGAVFLAIVATDPATLLGYGTWAAFGAGRMLVGRDSGDTDFDTVEETGGAKTHGHSFTQPSAHSDHAALSHSAHTGTAVGASGAGSSHTHTGPSHTHDYTQVPNHVHRQQYNPTTTGAGSGPTTAPDTSSSGTTDWGTVDTKNPTGGVATGTTVAGGTGATGAESAHTHAAGSVTQPSAHSDHAAQSHSAHSGGAVVDGSTLPPYIVVYMWKRTA